MLSNSRTDKAQIREYCPIEQDGIAGKIANEIAQAFEVKTADIQTRNADGPRNWIIESCDELSERALSRTIYSRDGHVFTRQDSERRDVKQMAVLRISKLDLVKIDSRWMFFRKAYRGSRICHAGMRQKQRLHLSNTGKDLLGSGKISAAPLS